MPKYFDSCCYRWTLKTGTLVLGWLSTILGFSGILGGLIGIGIYSFRPVVVGALSASLIACGLGLAVGIMLLMGVRQKRPRLITLWIIYSTDVLVLYGTACVLWFITEIAMNKIGVGFLHIVMNSAIFALVFYTVMVVRSYRTELKAQDAALKIQNDGYSFTQF